MILTVVTPNVERSTSRGVTFSHAPTAPSLSHAATTRGGDSCAAPPLAPPGAGAPPVPVTPPASLPLTRAPVRLLTQPRTRMPMHAARRAERFILVAPPAATMFCTLRAYDRLTFAGSVARRTAAARAV